MKTRQSTLRWYALWYTLLSFPFLAFSQSGIHDLRILLSEVDCNNQNVYFNLDVKSNAPDAAFHVGDMNLRISFNRSSIKPNSAVIDRELDLSGLVEEPPGEYSFYYPHSLLGSIDTVISYSFILGGGIGLLAPSDEWIGIGRVKTDFVLGGGYAEFYVHDGTVFPNSWVMEKFEDEEYLTQSGAYTGLLVPIDNLCNGNLPIELLAFTAKAIDCKIHLNWSTASETENDYFIIERSEDGLDFEPIAWISGAGNSEEENSYEYTEEGMRRDGYYRLVDVDFEGNRNYHPALYMKTTCANNSLVGAQQVYPNPVPSGRYLKFDFDALNEDNTGIYEITNLMGQKLITQPFTIMEGINELKIGVDDLPKGTYFLKVISKNWYAKPISFQKI